MYEFCKKCRKTLGITIKILSLMSLGCFCYMKIYELKGGRS